MRHGKGVSLAVLRVAVCAVVFSILFLTSAQAFAERVAAVNVEGLATIPEEKVMELIGIEPGDEFSLQEVDRSLEYMRTWGVFDVIRVSPSMTDEGVVLDYYVEEATIVASVDVAGNYPYIENKVRKRLTLHPGDVYTPERLLEQIERIKEFYKSEGYVGTEVHVDEEPRPDVHGVSLTFHISHGGLIRYRDIVVMGNEAYPDGRFVSAINPYKAYSERRLRNSIRKLRDFYHKQGYPKARIKLAKKKIDYEAMRIDITIDVSEGPKVDVRFVGAEHTSRRLMRKRITIFREGAVDQFEIESSADALVELFKERGYPDAKVEWHKEIDENGTVVITFLIDEGPSKRIRWLRFDDPEKVKSKKLAENMENRQMKFGDRGAFKPEDVEEDDAVILRAMKGKGYIDAEVGPWQIKPTPQGFALDVTVPIEAGPQTIVGSVEFMGGDVLDRKQMLKAIEIRPGRPFDEPGLLDDKQRLLNFFADNGYPYANIEQGFTVDRASNTADIRYDITPGNFVSVGNIYIVGDVLTSQKAIKKAMDIKEGAPFSRKKLIDSQLSIRRLGPFSYVSIETIGIEERRDVVHLKVKVEEQRPYMLDLGLSYSTDESFTGSLTFRNINAFGWAKTNAMSLTAGQNLSRVEMRWLDPRFVGSKFEMLSAAWVQYKKQPAYAYTEIAGAIGWIRRLSRWTFYFNFEIDRNYFVEGDSVAADADSLRDNTIFKNSLSSSYDSRDSFSFPTKGIYTYGLVSFFDEIKGNEAHFVKFVWQFEYDLGFLRRFVLSSALRTSHIQKLGRNISIPANERLYMGGDDTVRGFAYQSLGPTNAAGQAIGSFTRWITNFELRMLIWRRLSIAAFYDMGSLTPNYSDVTLTTIRNSAGAGLRYNTPVGPVRLDVGFPLDRRPNESRARLHFTFGYVF
jgi:outer membrane protein insertion porin family